VTAPLAITRANLPAAYVGRWYQARLTQNGGGLLPLTWSVVPIVVSPTVVTGALPTGLQLAPDGLVYGMPVAAQGTVAIGFQVRDAADVTVQALVWINVEAAPLSEPSNPNLQTVNPDFAYGP
jgi:hypothetical protein